MCASGPGRSRRSLHGWCAAYRPRPTRRGADGRVGNRTQARQRGHPDERHRQHRVRVPLREQGRGRQRRLDSVQGGGPSVRRGVSACRPWISPDPQIYPCPTPTPTVRAAGRGGTSTFASTTVKARPARVARTCPASPRRRARPSPRSAQRRCRPAAAPPPPAHPACRPASSSPPRRRGAKPRRQVVAPAARAADSGPSSRCHSTLSRSPRAWRVVGLAAFGRRT